MHKGLIRFAVVAFALGLMAGCSSYTRLLKSQDHEKMYGAALKYYQAKKYQRALQLFEEVDPYFQGTQREDTIKFYMASSYYNQGDFETSSTLLDQFRRQHRTSPFLEQAEYIYCMGFYYSSPQAERDQSNTAKAMSSIYDYLDRYPASAKKDDLKGYLAELQAKLYEKDYLNAKVYYNTYKYKSAVVALQNAVGKSPESPWREEMMYLIVKSGYQLASNSIPSLQMDRYLKMMDYYLNFASEYPESKYMRELDKMMDDAKAYMAAHKEQNKDNTENTPVENGTKKE